MNTNKILFALSQVLFHYESSRKVALRFIHTFWGSILFTAASYALDKHWTGASNTAWHNVGNWEDRDVNTSQWIAATALPGVADDVFLDPDYATNKTITISTNVLCKNLMWTDATSSDPLMTLAENSGTISIAVGVQILWRL